MLLQYGTMQRLHVLISTFLQFALEIPFLNRSHQSSTTFNFSMCHRIDLLELSVYIAHLNGQKQNLLVGSIFSTVFSLEIFP